MVLNFFFVRKLHCYPFHFFPFQLRSPTLFVCYATSPMTTEIFTALGRACEAHAPPEDFCRKRTSGACVARFCFGRLLLSRLTTLYLPPYLVGSEFQWCVSARFVPFVFICLAARLVQYGFHIFIFVLWCGVCDDI